ncbi:MAG: hypothetical protein J6Y16_12030, partial [Treponema sp.]|nr:hypothetical protein [Treponema sp.]
LPFPSNSTILFIEVSFVLVRFTKNTIMKSDLFFYALIRLSTTFDYNSFFDDKPLNFYVLHDNKKYSKEDARKTKGYLKSEIKFTVKLMGNTKLKINLFNRSYSSDALNYGQRYIYMNYRFVTDTSKKEIFFENTNEDTLIYKVLYKQTDSNIECCDASRIKDNCHFQKILM